MRHFSWVLILVAACGSKTPPPKSPEHATEPAAVACDNPEGGCVGREPTAVACDQPTGCVEREPTSTPSNSGPATAAPAPVTLPPLKCDDPGGCV